jgi:hypothetical protein
VPPTTASPGRLATPSIGAIGAVIIGILAFHDKRESQGTEYLWLHRDNPPVWHGSSQPS